jgi:predicted patatin/cPLA2 family phospholipase
MKKVALVLEGGGLRGIFSAGVLDVFLDEKIKVDCIIGVSAGALFGVNYCSKQKGRALRYNQKYGADKRYMGFHSLITTGNIMNKKFCFDTLVNELDPFDYDTFKKSKVDFYATVTNLRTGKPEYKLVEDMRRERDMEILRASGSMPCVSKPVKIDNDLYLDGAIGDSIPVLKALAMGYEKVIVVTTRVDSYRMPHKKRPYAKLMYRKYPKFYEAFLNRDQMYNKTLEDIQKLEDEGKILVIKPTRLVKISRVEKDPKIMQEQYDLGVNDTKNRLKDIKNYLK